MFSCTPSGFVERGSETRMPDENYYHKTKVSLFIRECIHRCLLTVSKYQPRRNVIIIHRTTIRLDASSCTQASTSTQTRCSRGSSYAKVLIANFLTKANYSKCTAVEKVAKMASSKSLLRWEAAAGTSGHLKKHGRSMMEPRSLFSFQTVRTIDHYMGGVEI